MNRPTALIEVEVDVEEPLSPEDAAKKAWESVQRWVREGYLPVVTVVMPDGEGHDVDLEALAAFEDEARLNEEVLKRAADVRAPQHDDGWED